MVFSEFRDALQDQFGAEAAAARHEIFFIARRRSRLLQRVHATLAALRDAWQCLRLPATAQPLPGIVAVATLDGANGWGCLAPYLDELKARGIACDALIHPRLRGRLQGRLPNPPSASAWRHALSALTLRFATTAAAVAPAWVVRCGIFRQRLWRDALARTLDGGSGALLLHNDFDLYSVAAIEAGRGRWRSVCVQHGLPTDEFFPTRADAQIVWGETSAQVYVQQGSAAGTLHFGRARSLDATSDASQPQALYVVSQTHTPIFGRPLEHDFHELAQQLARRFAGTLPLEILLHPDEARKAHPYASADLAARCRIPPHDALSNAIPKAIIVGFCSTALIDAACRGHYVIGMDWPALASKSALAVGRPAHGASDIDALAEMIRTLLAQPEARRHFLAAQNEWLGRTFAGDAQWPRRLEVQR